MAQSPRRYLSKNALSEAIGKSRATIEQWNKLGLPAVQQPGIDGAKTWLYDLSDVLEWLMTTMEMQNGRIRQKQLTHKHDPGDTKTNHGPLTTDATQTEAMRRFEIARARKAEIQADREEGRTLYIEEITPVLADLFTQTRQTLLQAPDKIAHKVAAESDPAQCRHIIRTQLVKALTDISDGDLIDQIFDELHQP